MHIYIHAKTELTKTETANFRLFAAKGSGKRKFVFLGWQTINGYRRLLFHQMCPSMHTCTLCNVQILIASLVSRSNSTMTKPGQRMVLKLSKPTNIKMILEGKASCHLYRVPPTEGTMARDEEVDLCRPTEVFITSLR
jgi:hypothetical protein